MFLLQKATDVTDDDLLEVLAYPDTDEAVVRATMIASIDGAATVDGRSGRLGGDGDHRIFHTMRALADAVVVGARTAIDEGYGPVAGGKTLVLASRSLDVPADFATATAPTTIIATCRSAPADRRDRLVSAGATVVDCGTDTVEPALIVDALVARGCRRIDLEGGPRLLAEFAAAGLLDQLIYSMSPTMVGGTAVRIAHGATPPAPAGLPYPMTPLRTLGDDDGYLYILWDRCR